MAYSLWKRYLFSSGLHQAWGRLFRDALQFCSKWKSQRHLNPFQLLHVICSKPLLRVPRRKWLLRLQQLATLWNCGWRDPSSCADNCLTLKALGQKENSEAHSRRWSDVSLEMTYLVTRWRCWMRPCELWWRRISLPNGLKLRNRIATDELIVFHEILHTLSSSALCNLRLRGWRHTSNVRRGVWHLGGAP